MEDLLASLEGLGFTALDSKIYLTLLDHGTMSPYQIAKKITISRSSIYNALEHMVQKGMVEVVPGDTVLYLAQQPEVFMGKVKNDYLRNMQNARAGLAHYLETRYEETYALVNGFDIIIEKAKSILRNAKKEVFMNTDIDLEMLSEELSGAAKRGVRIVVFSFVELSVSCKEIEIYSHERNRTAENTNRRFMIVADNLVAMVADADNGRSNWTGTVTNNSLMKSIVREHIHNDIYMLKLRQLYGPQIYEKIHINTSQEEKQF